MSERLIEAARVTGREPSEDRYEALVPQQMLVREAVACLAHGTMNYRCEVCGFEWEVWLGMGVEGPQALKNAGLFVPCAFVIGRCPAWPVRADATEEERAQLRDMGPCDGQMTHVEFSRDRRFDSPQMVPDDRARFVLDPWYDQGQLVIPEPALIGARRWHRERLA